MKQHDIHNDEALYQQILAELAPGAEEYDRMMAEGKHPAAKKHRTIPYYKYVAAACVLFAIVGGVWLWQNREEDNAQTSLVAQVDPVKQDHTDTSNRMPSEEVLQPEETSIPSPRHQKVHQRRKRIARPHHATQTAPVKEESLENAIEAPDQELYLALLAEVEARETQIEQLKQQSMRVLFDELIYNIEQQPNRPELIL